MKIKLRFFSALIISCYSIVLIPVGGSNSNTVIRDNKTMAGYYHYDDDQISVHLNLREDSVFVYSEYVYIRRYSPIFSDGYWTVENDSISFDKQFMVSSNRNSPRHTSRVIRFMCGARLFFDMYPPMRILADDTIECFHINGRMDTTIHPHRILLVRDTTIKTEFFRDESVSKE